MNEDQKKRLARANERARQLRAKSTTTAAQSLGSFVAAHALPKLPELTLTSGAVLDVISLVRQVPHEVSAPFLEGMLQQQIAAHGMAIAAAVKSGAETPKAPQSIGVLAMLSALGRWIR